MIGQGGQAGMAGALEAAPVPPRATYRLQFNREFTLADAAGLLPYLDALGISHVYASPYLQARSGSTHGYDITNHNAINPEVGGEAGLDRFVDGLRRRGMGQILDFVPNHMGVGRADNPWWLDVLEWGRSSPYAAYFDIDWQPAKAELRNKVLLPFLGDHYGAVLEAGTLQLAFDRQSGDLSVRYHEHAFPVSPPRYARVLDGAIARLTQSADGSAPAAELTRIAAGFRELRPAGVAIRRRPGMRAKAEALKQELAALAAEDAEAREALDATVADLNGTAGDGRSFARLHRLLEAQAYRLSYWRVAADEINYRRFFDINELAGLRIELPELFEQVHALVFRLVAERRLDGLRIDHIDGLFDPRQYCERLAQRMRELDAPGLVFVEKILAPYEFLPEDWPVSGTTGYEFASQVGGLFVDAAGERRLTRAYARLTGAPADFDDVLYRAKKHVMARMLAGELQVLATELDRIAESSWRTRDYTRNTLADALEEVVACFPVYRTYVTARGASPQDRRYIDWAVSQARKRSAVPDEVFDFIHAALTGDLARATARGYGRRQVIRFAMAFQQYTSPVMAKSMEDTAFYRYNRLVSLNEVGGDPRRFGVSAAAFHHMNQERARRWPDSMLSTSTHDTKRGEDVRARLNVLSEIPDEWARQVRLWARLNRRLKRAVDDRPAPDANDEYLLYQTLLGSWPAALTGEAAPPAEALAEYGERIAAYMTKAIREAKVNSSWARENAPYEEALSAFAARLLSVHEPNPFLGEFVAFQARVARAGVINGLAQTLLKLAVPGIPDIYQGSELWDLRLVDPDNRRPVDYARRADMLGELSAEFGEPAGPETAPGARRLLDNWQDGRIKLYLVWRLLALRRERPALFARGRYAPLEAAGRRAEHVCAFARVDGAEAAVFAAPRLVAGLGGLEAPPVGAELWRETTIAAPAEAGARAFRDLLSGRTVRPSDADDGPRLNVAELFRDLPVAALVAEPEAA